MAQQTRPDGIQISEPPAPPADTLQIDTPVIDMQDLEHDPGPQTRVSNADVKVEPTMDGEEVRDPVKENEAVLEALAEFEKRSREQPPS